jgi:hypothetical protein
MITLSPRFKLARAAAQPPKPPPIITTSAFCSESWRAVAKFGRHNAAPTRGVNALRVKVVGEDVSEDFFAWGGINWLTKERFR